MVTQLEKYEAQVGLHVFLSECRTGLAWVLSSLCLASIAVAFLHIQPPTVAFRLIFGILLPMLMFVAFMSKVLRLKNATLLCETAEWLLLCTGVVLSPILPVMVAGMALQLQARYSYEGRYRATRKLSAFRMLCPKRRVGFLADLMGAVTADAIFNTGDFSRGIAIAKITAENANATYQQKQNDETAVAVVCANGILVRLLALHGLSSEARDLYHQRLGNPPSCEQSFYKALAAAEIASAALTIGEYELALSNARLASALLDQGGLPNNTDIKPIRASLAEDCAEAYFGLGDYERADEFAHDAISRWTEVAGKQNIRVANMHKIIGAVALKRKGIEQASDEFALAVAIRRVRGGKRDPELASCLQGLVRCLEAKGDAAGATRLQQTMQLVNKEHHQAN